MIVVGSKVDHVFNVTRKDGIVRVLSDDRSRAVVKWPDGDERVVPIGNLALVPEPRPTVLETATSGTLTGRIGLDESYLGNEPRESEVKMFERELEIQHAFYVAAVERAQEALNAIKERIQNEEDPRSEEVQNVLEAAKEMFAAQGNYSHTRRMFGTIRQLWKTVRA